MNKTLTIRIPKRTQSEWVCLGLIAMPFAFGLVIDLLHGPAAIKYATDLLWVFLLCTMAYNRFRIFGREIRKLRYCFVALLVVSVAGLILNMYSPLYYLWGFRNQFRFFFFFFSCTVCLKKDNAEEVLNLFDVMFYINFAVTLIQYAFFGKRQDYLGGIFGTSVGCNAKTIILLAIVTSRSILGYLNKQEKGFLFALKGSMALLVAALAELKFFFVLFVIIVVMAALLTGFSFRKLVMICLSLVGLYAGIRILTTIFPMWENWFSIRTILETALSSEGYTGKGDMNRLTSIPIVLDRFLVSFDKKLFGLGLGSCDTSAFSFLNTPFYRRYGYLRYNWFSGAFTLLELGLLGLSLYILFFVQLYLGARKQEKSGNCTPLYSQLARIMVAVSLILNLYNASMRVEEAYFIYFVMAIPFLRDKQSGRKAG